MALSFTWKTREGLVKVAEGVRVNVSITRAPSVPVFRSHQEKTRVKQCGKKLVFTFPRRIYAPEPCTWCGYLGSKKFCGCGSEHCKCATCKRMVWTHPTDGTCPDCGGMSFPGKRMYGTSFQEDLTLSPESVANPSTDLADAPLPHCDFERVHLLDATLVESKVPRPLRRERLLKVLVGRAPKERKQSEDDELAWRFDE